MFVKELKFRPKIEILAQIQNLAQQGNFDKKN